MYKTFDLLDKLNEGTLPKSPNIKKVLVRHFGENILNYLQYTKDDYVYDDGKRFMMGRVCFFLPRMYNKDILDNIGMESLID